MTNYKLTYFDLRGRGEIIRLVFAAAGVQYEDYRIKSEWAELKARKLAVHVNLVLTRFFMRLQWRIEDLHNGDRRFGGTEDPQ